MAGKVVAILGATGVVGTQMMQCLEERDFPVSKLVPLASARSAGRKLQFRGGEVTVQEATPEAFEGGDPHALGLVMLIGVLALYAAESFIGSAGHDHGHHEAMSEGGAGILAGTFLHTICDGVVIACSYMSDIHVGIAMTVAVLSHEIAHEIGDYAVLVSLGMSRGRAYCVNAAAFLGSMAGGLAAYFVISGFDNLLPYALALSGASFLYVGLSDLLPRFRAHDGFRRNAARLILILAGVALCLLIASHD